MTILSSINDWITGWTKTFEQGSQTKLLSEVFTFAAGFPYTQIAAAAVAEGTNVPLDVTAAAALFADFMKAFYSGQTPQAATLALTVKVGIHPATAALIVFDPVHPADPTQFSRGR